MVTHDPRRPPLDTGMCLCVECALWVYEEMAEEHEREAQECRKQIEKLHNEN